MSAANTHPTPPTLSPTLRPSRRATPCRPALFLALLRRRASCRSRRCSSRHSGAVSQAVSMPPGSSTLARAALVHGASLLQRHYSPCRASLAPVTAAVRPLHTTHGLRTSDEILLYHPLSCDAQTHKSQWEDFLVAKFLSGLDNNSKMVRDHLLASDSIPTLSNALSRVLRVATGSSDSSSSSGTTIESSTMGVRDRGRSSSRGRGGRGCGSNNTVTSGGEPAALEPSPNPSE
ncbi:UNVERIFIED_CONTAM: hypothetical protein Sradi_0164800 [Sesamum radiatum]|uniref:Uncharacterized protein n=1 Tax=Sesamum radiatum TaxID=300843 RepID=A0AAW2WME9_SESRA